MPPRFAYWTILLDGKPTAFRAAEQEELLPTFKRLQDKHPDAVMRWFARGKLWASPEEARAETTRRPTAAADAANRGRDWRPGGSHRDPRQPYKDAKKQRNQDRRQRRFEYRAKDDQPRPKGPGPKTGGWNARPAPPRDERFSEPRPPKKEWSGPPASGRREFKPWSDRPKPAGRWPRDERKEGGAAPKTGGWSDRPARPREERPPDSRPTKKEWSGGPPASGRREFKPWDERPKPAGRWPRDERKEGGAAPKTGGWSDRPARPREERPPDSRPTKKEWSGGPPASGRREFKPWNDRPKPAGRWPRDERKEGGAAPKAGGWSNRPARPREERPPDSRPAKKEWSGGPPASGRREFKPWNDRPKPAGRGQSDRPPSKGPRDGGSRDGGPRNKGPRGPKR